MAYAPALASEATAWSGLARAATVADPISFHSVYALNLPTLGILPPETSEPNSRFPSHYENVLFGGAY